MAEKIVGSAFDESVQKQIEKREEVFSKTVRTDEQLMYMNSNNVWAKLSSSINIQTNSYAPEQFYFAEPFVEEDLGDNTLAKKNILRNGVFESKKSLSGGINIESGFDPNQASKFNTDIKRKGTYQNFTSRGIRPEPGIVDINIVSKNTYGTLREATVNIVVWSLEDLEMMQTLYMRPGFSVLLEWGHTLWIDNEGELNKEVNTFDAFVEIDFPEKEIYENLDKLRRESDNNYDAMFGYVVNFNWSFREDGGYDCMIKIISRGSVLESIGHIFEPSGRLPNTEFRVDADDSDREERDSERTSVWHKFATELSEAETKAYKSITRKSFVKNKGFAKDFRDKLLPFIGYDLEQKEAGTGWPYGLTDWFMDSINSIIVPLYTILDVYNKFIAPNTGEPDEQLVKFYTGETDKEPNSKEYEKECKFLTGKYHFSVNPLVCVLPKEPENLKVRGDNYELFKIGKGSSGDQKTLNHPGTAQLILPARGTVDDILNIQVGIINVVKRVENIVNSSEKPEKGFYYVLEAVLQDINKSLGGINELAIHYDESENINYIVDRKLTPVKKDDVSTITLTGLKTTLSSLQISSKISSEMAGMISIAAQGGSNEGADDVGSMMKWNEGLIDRHIPKKRTSTAEVDKSRRDKEEQRLVDFLEDLKGVLNDFREDKYDESDYMKLTSYHKEFCINYVVGEYVREGNQSIPGMIPVELSFETIGIGGLKIGQAFKITEGVLPQKYTDSFGFLITGLSHTLGQGKWITKVKTQFFPIQ